MLYDTIWSLKKVMFRGENIMKKVYLSPRDYIFSKADIDVIDAFLKRYFNFDNMAGDYATLKQLRNAMVILANKKFPVTFSDGKNSLDAYNRLVEVAKRAITPGFEEYEYSTQLNTYSNICDLMDVKLRVLNGLRELYSDTSINLTSKEQKAISDVASTIANSVFADYRSLISATEELSGFGIPNIELLPGQFILKQQRNGRMTAKTFEIANLGKTKEGMAMFLKFMNDNRSEIYRRLNNNQTVLAGIFPNTATRIIGYCGNPARRKHNLENYTNYWNSKTTELDKNKKTKKFAEKLSEEVLNVPTYLDFFAPYGQPQDSSEIDAMNTQFACGGFGDVYPVKGATFVDKDGKKQTVKLRLSNVRTYEDWKKNTASGLMNQKSLKNGVLGGREIKSEEDYIRFVNSDAFVEYVQSLEVGLTVNDPTKIPNGFYYDKGTRKAYATEVILCPKKTYGNLSYLLEEYNGKGRMQNTHQLLTGKTDVPTQIFNGIPCDDYGNPMFVVERNAQDCPIWIVRTGAMLGALAIALPYAVAFKSMCDDARDALHNRPKPPVFPENTDRTTDIEETKSPDSETTRVSDVTEIPSTEQTTYPESDNPAKTDTPTDTTRQPETRPITRPTTTEETRRPSVPDTELPETAPSPITRVPETTRTPETTKTPETTTNSGIITRNEYRPGVPDYSPVESGATPITRQNSAETTEPEYRPSVPDTENSNTGSSSRNPALDLSGSDTGSTTMPGTEYYPAYKDESYVSGGQTSGSSNVDRNNKNPGADNESVEQGPMPN